MKDFAPTTDPALHSTSLHRVLAGVATILVAAALVALPGRPAFATPVLAISPPSGPPGTEITVSGTGFTAAVIDIHWGTQDGPHLARTAGPEFSAFATVPDAPPNSHQVFAVIRNGNAVTTSSAPFQVTAGEVVTTTTAPPTTRGTTAPAAGTARQASGVGGGAEDMADTVGGASGGQPAAGGGTGGTAAATTTSTTAAVPTTIAGTPGTPVDGATAAPPTSPGAPVDTVSRVAGERTATDAALGQRPASQSSGVVRNPALLMIGLGIVFLGGAFLAVRNRQRLGG